MLTPSCSYGSGQTDRQTGKQADRQIHTHTYTNTHTHTHTNTHTHTRFANGDVYVGEWQRGMRHGKGKIERGPTSSETNFKGQWEFDRPCAPPGFPFLFFYF